ncbi:MAG: hypothetical protein AB7I19_04110 [Planctomycetota bacterium]
MSQAFDRRELFRRSSFLAAAAAVPTWLQRGFDQWRPGQDRREALRGAVRRARERGKLLLIVVIPQSNLAWERGTDLGATFTHASPRTLMKLAVCEPACATPQEIEKELGITTAADAWCVCVTQAATDGKWIAHGRAVTPNLDELPPPIEMAPDEPWEAFQKRAESRVRAKIEKIERALQGTIDLQVASLDLAEPSKDLVEKIESLVSRKKLEPADLAFAFAHAPTLVTQLDRETDRQRRARLVEALIGAGRKHFREDRVPGCKWAISSGCGLAFEGEKNADAGMIACGMGRVDPLSERMLYLHLDANER